MLTLAIFSYLPSLYIYICVCVFIFLSSPYYSTLGPSDVTTFLGRFLKCIMSLWLCSYRRSKAEASSWTLHCRPIQAIRAESPACHHSLAPWHAFLFIHRMPLWGLTEKRPCHLRQALEEPEKHSIVTGCKWQRCHFHYYLRVRLGTFNVTFLLKDQSSSWQ